MYHATFSCADHIAVASSQLLISSTRWTSCTVLWWNSAHQLHAPQCQQDPSKIHAPLWERHLVSNTNSWFGFQELEWTGANKSFFQVWVQMGWWGANQETDWGFSTEICWVLDGLDRGPAWWRIHLPSETWYFNNSFWIWYYLVKKSFVNPTRVPHLWGLIALNHSCRNPFPTKFQGSCEDNIQAPFPCLCPYLPHTFSEDYEP